MVNKIPWYKNPTAVISTVAGVIAAFGILVTSNVKLTRFLTVTDAVEAADKKIEEVKEEVSGIKDYIKEQQISQRLLEKIVTKDEADDEVIISPDGKQYFDKIKDKWLPIKK